MIKKKKAKQKPKSPEVSAEWVNISKVKLWKNNPRKNDKSAKELAKLLKEHGQKSPIVVWSKNNTIYKGNTTWKALNLLGAEKVWVAYVDFKNEAEAISYALADNKSSEWSEWDDKVLANLLPETFKGDSHDNIAKLTGFSEKDVAGFFAGEGQEIPMALENVDLQGVGMEDKIDYLVIQFTSNSEMKKFRQRFDSDAKHPRVITFDSLLRSMEFKAERDAPVKKKKKIIKKKKGKF